MIFSRYSAKTSSQRTSTCDDSASFISLHAYPVVKLLEIKSMDLKSLWTLHSFVHHTTPLNFSSFIRFVQFVRSRHIPERLSSLIELFQIPSLLHGSCSGTCDWDSGVLVQAFRKYRPLCYIGCMRGRQRMGYQPACPLPDLGYHPAAVVVCSQRPLRSP